MRREIDLRKGVNGYLTGVSGWRESVNRTAHKFTMVTDWKIFLNCIKED